MKNIQFLFLTVLPIFLIVTFLSGLPTMETNLRMDQQFLHCEYGTIWYQKWFTKKTNNKTPIIFIHGGPGLESGYIINLKSLAYNQPCIFYDQSGCGKSIVTNNTSIEWTLEHYVRELAMFIDALGYKKVILFGYSWGAAIATTYTLENQGRVEKLILASPYISTPHLVENYKQLALSKNIYDAIKKHEDNGTLESPEYQEACSIFFKNFIFTKDPSIFDNFTNNKEISEIMWGNNEFTATGNVKNLNLIPLLHNLTLPVLLTAGRSDLMTPAYMELLHEKIKNSRLLIFEHSSHMPHREEEDEYCKAIYNFLGN